MISPRVLVQGGLNELLSLGSKSAASIRGPVSREAAQQTLNILRATLPTMTAGIPNDVSTEASKTQQQAEGTWIDMTTEQVSSTIPAPAAAQPTATSLNLAAGSTVKVGGTILPLNPMSFIPGGVNNAIVSTASSIALGQLQSRVRSPALNTGLSIITSAVNAARNGAPPQSTLGLNGLPTVGGSPVIGSTAVTGALANGAAGTINNTISSVGFSGLSRNTAATLRTAAAGLAKTSQSSAPVQVVNTTPQLSQSIKTVVTGLVGQGVPVPNFSGNPATYGVTQAEAKIARTAAYTGAIQNSAQQLRVDDATVLKARQALDTAFATLPAGSPEVATARQALDAALKGASTNQNELINAIQSAPRSSGQPTTWTDTTGSEWVTF